MLSVIPSYLQRLSWQVPRPAMPHYTCPPSLPPRCSLFPSPPPLLSSYGPFCLGHPFLAFLLAAPTDLPEKACTRPPVGRPLLSHPQHTPHLSLCLPGERGVLSQALTYGKCSVSALCGYSLDGWSRVSASALLSHVIRESETREFLSVPQNNCHRTGRKGCLLTISTSVTQKGLILSWEGR